MLRIVVALSLFTPLTLLAEGPRVAPGPVVVQLRSGQLKPEQLAGFVVRLGARHAGSDRTGRATFDGVPAGRFRLRIAPAGFDEVDREIELAPGARKPIEITLTPVARMTLSGQLEDELGTPLASGWIELKPVAVAATRRGPLISRTGWDGKFELLQVPVGRYAATLSAPGCARRTLEVTLRPKLPAVRWELRRTSTAASLAVTVTDAISKAPIEGAKVELAEAYPKGLIGSAVTKGGAARFPELRLGLRNVADKDGRLAISRPRAQLQVSAKGYETTRVPVTLQAGQTAAVALTPLKRIVEVEPNNDFASAQRVRTGAPILLEIKRKGDRDFFRFRLAHRARVRVELDSKDKLEADLVLRRATGEKVAGSWFWHSHDGALQHDLAAGEYVVEVGEHGNNGVSAKPIELRILQRSALDSHEPNDIGSAGRRLHAGRVARGTIFPLGDVDVWRIETERPGWIRLDIPPRPWEAKITVVDATGKAIGSSWNWVNRAVRLDVHLPRPGRYRVEVREQGDNACTPDPYELSLAAVEDDRIDDPRSTGRLRALRQLPLDALVTTMIAPQGDVDRWAIPIPSSGVLHVEGIGPVETRLRLLDSRGRKLAESWNWVRRTAALHHHVEGPTTVFLEVGEQGDNAWSPSPIVLRSRWEPCDQHEVLGRNDRPDEATPIALDEPIRGSINPRGDIDVYRAVVDHPGWLTITSHGNPVEVVLSLRRADGREPLARSWNWVGRSTAIQAPVLPGEYLIEVRDQGDNHASAADYHVDVTFDRADPVERAPLARDAPRTLRLNEAQPIAFEHIGDVDRLTLAVPEKGSYLLQAWAPTELHLVVHDALSGKKLIDSWAWSRRVWRLELKAGGPTRYRLQLDGRRGRSAESGWLLVSRKPRQGQPPALIGESIRGQAAPHDPTRVRFSRQAVKGLGSAREVALDLDGDGRFERPLPVDGVEHRYPREGVYPATARLTGAAGQTSLLRFWVRAEGPRERKGIMLRVIHPSPGATVEGPGALRAHAISYSGQRIRALSLRIDGRAAGTSYRRPFAFPVAWERLGPGPHELTLTAVDRAGERKTIKQAFRVSPTFDLTPADGAMLTGESVVVAWRGAAFGAARVRYRAVGAKDWREAVGESARERRVELSGLEPGRAYEWQVIGAEEPGPLRTVTRVPGLAFSSRVYSTTIPRDYDQRIAVAVRNHGEKPRAVRLSAKPPRGSKMIIGFVGEGSKGAPVELGPGEEREFVLSLHAQDVIRARHQLAIVLDADEGGHDEAAVVVEVKLPRVELVLERAGPLRGALGERVWLRNKGDTLTDVDVVADEGLLVSPAMHHALLPAGRTVELIVRPRLHDGFQKIAGKVRVRALGKETTHDVAFALAEGEQVYEVPLIPGAGGEREVDSELHLARAAAAAYLDPGTIDWSARPQPSDTDGDGKADRWQTVDESTGVLWVGDDTDGDGAVDFVHADMGQDGVFDLSAFRKGKGWERTNLVEAWLEMGFKLPWARGTYKPHDLDVVLNGEVIGKLRDEVPEGNYRFRLPPSALRFGPDGQPQANKVEIKSRHLNGGHYVVNSDFRITLRLTGTRTMVVARSPEAARQQAHALQGVQLSGPDYSLSSSELSIEGRPAAGQQVVVQVPLRNVGATPGGPVVVALLRAEPGRKGLELTRSEVPGVPLDGELLVKLPWTVAPGRHTLMVVVDPDGTTDDPDRRNNQAMIPLTVPGKDAPPTLAINEPTKDAKLTSGALRLVATASDAVGLARVECRIDGGAWQPLSRKAGDSWAASGLLQPGRHTLTVRAVDSGGNAVEAKVAVTVAAPEQKPAVRFSAPAAGAIDQRKVAVELALEGDVALAAVRVAGGPWREAKIDGATASLELPLAFGDQRLEARVVDRAGVVADATLQLRCTQQPTADETVVPPPASRGVLEVEGIGPVAVLKSPSTLANARGEGRARVDQRQDALDTLAQRDRELKLALSDADEAASPALRRELADLYARRAVLHCGREEIRPAVNLMTESCELDPSHPGRWEQLGDWLTFLDEPLALPLAQNAWEKALALKPKPARERRLRLRLSGCLMHQRRLPAAREHLELLVAGIGRDGPEAEQIGPLVACWAELDEAERGVAFCKRQLARGGDDRIKIGLAIMTRLAGRTADAQALLAEVVGNAKNDEKLRAYATSLQKRYRELGEEK